MARVTHKPQTRKLSKMSKIKWDKNNFYLAGDVAGAKEESERAECV